MTKVIDEVRAISSQKIAEKQKESENNYPNVVEKIKDAAAMGETRCEFAEYAIDQYTKRLLEQDGFQVWATTRRHDDINLSFIQRGTKKVWIVSW